MIISTFNDLNQSLSIDNLDPNLQMMASQIMASNAIRVLKNMGEINRISGAKIALTAEAVTVEAFRELQKELTVKELVIIQTFISFAYSCGLVDAVYHYKNEGIDKKEDKVYPDDTNTNLDESVWQSFLDSLPDV